MSEVAKQAMSQFPSAERIRVSDVTLSVAAPALPLEQTGLSSG